MTDQPRRGRRPLAAALPRMRHHAAGPPSLDTLTPRQMTVYRSLRARGETHENAAYAAARAKPD